MSLADRIAGESDGPARDHALTTRQDSASRWLGEHVDRRLRGVLSEVVKAGKVPGELEKNCLVYCIRICELESLRKDAERELRRSVADDEATFG